MIKMDKYKYLSDRRFFVFLDEWLFYLLLIFMYLSGFPYYIIIPTILIGAFMVYKGYKGYWRLLEKFDLK